MKTKLLPIICLVSLLVAAPVHAGWPDRVFAPYMFLGEGDDFKLTVCDDACGLKYYSLAFIIALQKGRGREATYEPAPSWYGQIPLEQNLYSDQIDAIRQRGGDVIVSFGGEAGRELANVISDPAQLQAAYQKVIDQYKFTWLDFDIEGRSLNKGQADSERRNTVLAALQKQNPGLFISFTLPVNPDGLSVESRTLLADAVKQGVKIHSVNLMVMYFGTRFINKGKSEAQLGIDSANQAHGQLQQIDPSVRIGLCPRLAENGSPDEVFTLEDAKALMAYADQTPWVCSLHYWLVNDDAVRPRDRQRMAVTTSNQKYPQPWAFARIFQPFTASP